MVHELRPKVGDVTIRRLKMKVSSEGKAGSESKKAEIWRTEFLRYIGSKGSIERHASEVMRSVGKWA